MKTDEEIGNYEIVMDISIPIILLKELTNQDIVEKNKELLNSVINKEIIITAEELLNTIGLNFSMFSATISIVDYTGYSNIYDPETDSQTLENEPKMSYDYEYDLLAEIFAEDLIWDDNEDILRDLSEEEIKFICEKYDSKKTGKYFNHWGNFPIISVIFSLMTYLDYRDNEGQLSVTMEFDNKEDKSAFMWELQEYLVNKKADKNHPLEDVTVDRY